MKGFRVQRFLKATVIAALVLGALWVVLTVIPDSVILWLLLAGNALVFVRSVQRRDEYLAAFSALAVIAGLLMVTGVVS